MQTVQQALLDDGRTIELRPIGPDDEERLEVFRYESITGTADAEGAWVVRDDHQGLGLGTLLARTVAEEAHRHGKRRLIAETLADNIAMRRVLLNFGLPASQQFRDGIVEMIIELDGG